MAVIRTHLTINPLKSKLSASGLKSHTTPRYFIQCVVCSAFMTGNDYINQNRTETFKAGDKVVMHTCCEARLPKYKDKLWTCQTDSFLSKGKEEVVFLEDFSGYFAAEFLQRVQS